MKSLTKISVMFFALLAMGIKAKAQNSANAGSSDKGVIYSVGADGGLSIGSFKNLYKTNIGGSLQADIPVVEQFYATVNAGFSDFIGKDNIYGSGISAPNLRVLPVMAGLKFFPVSEFYIQADAGAAFLLNKSDAGYSKTAVFLYTPQVGVQVPIGGKSFIDAGIRYERTTQFNSELQDSKLNFFGLRVAYAFGL
jgi:hypothetical protein